MINDTSGVNLFESMRNDLKKLLHEHVMSVVFTKKDGTDRTMLCTLLPEHLPAVDKQEGDEVKFLKKQNNESLAAWDLEKKAWRSFRIDSIKSYKASSL
jgi:hypothetical protein